MDELYTGFDSKEFQEDLALLRKQVEEMAVFSREKLSAGISPTELLEGAVKSF